jgi:hypothetical protein
MLLVSKGRNMNLKPGTILFMGLLMLFPFAIANGQSSKITLLDKRIFDFEENDAEAESILVRLAEEHKVPLGMEHVPLAPDGKRGKHINVKVERGTIRDVLNAITRADPRYEWVEADGVINVFPKQQKNSLLETTVDEFQVNQERADFAVDALMKLPEVKAKLEKMGLRFRNVISLPAGVPNSFPHPFSIYKATVRQVLNRLMKESDSYYWSFGVYGDHKEYFGLYI